MPQNDGQAKRTKATRRDDGPNRYDVMAELPCFAAAFRFGFVLTLFFSVSVFQAYLLLLFFTYLFRSAYHLIPLQLLLAFNTFLILAKARRKRIKEPQWIWYHFIHKQSILLCTHRTVQVTPHKTGSPPLCTSLLFPLLFLPLVCLVHSLLVLWHSLFENWYVQIAWYDDFCGLRAKFNLNSWQTDRRGPGKWAD